MSTVLQNYDRYCNYMKDHGAEPIPFKEFVHICIELEDILEGGDHNVGSISDFMGSN